MEKVLYAGDMSANEQEIRIAFVPGNEAAGYTPGFYVWLGTHLIGEALPGMDPAANGHIPGFVLSPQNKMPVDIPSASVTGGAYAPAE